MTSIEEVVARSRQPGGFSEHKRFTLARSRGIQKMRQFALADPHYYILELIQAAVANEASYIDIQVENPFVSLSYIGGGYHESQLAQLFDFLFASREDVEHGDLRLLALGINALMRFEPTEIVIESGDGTLKGTTRVVIKGREDVVDVGTPERALRGTYIRASGLNRRKLRGRSTLQPHELGPPECRAIEERCITAPVPILVNSHPIFGYSSQRTPASIFGMRRTQVFDEGELYGTLGLAARPSGASFRLVTHGVWIQSVTHPDYTDIGGIISFDRLRKTADHAGIVQDARYKEMWLRIQPYAYQLRSGGQGRKTSDIALLDGPPLQPHEIIASIREARGGVFVHPSIRTGTYTRDHALAIGQALSLPVVVVPENQRGILMGVAGPGALLIRPDLSDPEEVSFYQQAEALAPPRPWLLEPMELSPLELVQLKSWIRAEARLGPGVLAVAHGQQLSPGQRVLDERLPDEGSAGVTIYTPAEMEGHEQELRVEIRTAQRLVWTGWVESAYPGHVLVIEMPTLAPGALRRPLNEGGESLAELIAQAVVRHASRHFERASRRSMTEFVHRDIEPGSVAARMILAALARQTIKRLRTDEDGGVGVLFSSVDRAFDARLWDVPILETHTGRPISLRGLSTMLDETMGFVYGTVPDVEADLEGLDRDRILRLDLHTERMLIALLGQGAYIRVDSRDVLASYHGALCRDIALGLREYAEFPLLVEGAKTTMWIPEEQALCVKHLVEGLIATFTQPGFSPLIAEDRRQALRHLRWLAVWQHRNEAPFAMPDLTHYPLFSTADGRLSSLGQIREVFANGGRVRMLDGRSDDLTRYSGPQIAKLIADLGQQRPRPLEAIDLAMNPFVFHLLSALGPVEGGADFALHDAEAAVLEPTGEQVFLETINVDEPGFEGMIGLPLEAAARPAIVVVHPDRSQVYLLEEVAHSHGIVGLIRLQRTDVKPETIEVALRDAAHHLLQDLATRFASEHGTLAHQAYDRTVACLFGYAARNMTMTLQPGGSVAVDVWQGLAQFILDLPVFPGRAGLPLSAQRLLREFQLDMAVALKEGEVAERWKPASLGDDVPAALLGWLDATLRPDRIHGLSSRGRGTLRPAANVTPAGNTAIDALSAALNRWLTPLRPDLDDPADTSREGRRFNVVVEPPVANESAIAAFRFDDKGRPYVSVNVEHWLVQWNLAAMDDRALAWLLLGIYAIINERLATVTNTHELIFQKRVAEALEEGRLVHS